MKSKLQLALLVAASAATAAAATILSEEHADYHDSALLQKRAFFADGFKIYNRKRNAHACIMSIVFIVLLPLGAISTHLPLRGIRVTTRIHAPIQLLALAMLIGAMGIGISLADRDLNYFAKGSSTKAHIVIGLLLCCVLILFQPAMGILQHMHFKRTGNKSVFAPLHRWTGRVAICLGWINSGLGFQLYGIKLVSRHSLVRNFVIMGILGAIWFLLVSWDGYRSYVAKRDRLGSYRLTWQRGIVLKGQRDAEVPENKNAVKLGNISSSESRGKARVGERV